MWSIKYKLIRQVEDAYDIILTWHLADITTTNPLIVDNWELYTFL